MSAEQIVDAIIADIEDRSGLGNEWEALDEDIRGEIRAHWIAIASTPLGAAVPGLHEAYVTRNEQEAEIAKLREALAKVRANVNVAEDRARERDDSMGSLWMNVRFVVNEALGD